MPTSTQTAETPRRGKTPPPSKNRVWDFFGQTYSCTQENWQITQCSRPENDPTPTTTVSGVHYYGRRSYSPEQGRWPSRDPIEEQGGVNLYAALRNRAVRAIDALGLSSEPFVTVADSVTGVVYNSPDEVLPSSVPLPASSSTLGEITGVDSFPVIDPEDILISPGGGRERITLPGGKGIWVPRKPVYKKCYKAIRLYISMQLRDGLPDRPPAEVTHYGYINHGAPILRSSPAGNYYDHTGGFTAGYNGPGSINANALTRTMVIEHERGHLDGYFQILEDFKRDLIALKVTPGAEVTADKNYLLLLS